MRYRWRVRPYKHQVLAVRKLLRNGWGGALLMAPRTGKTKVVIDYACMLAKAGRVRKVLVVCPNRVMGTWVRAIAENATVVTQVVVWDKSGRKNKLADPPVSVDLQFVIINYEAFGVPGAVVKDRRTGRPQKDRHGRIKRSRVRGGRFTIKKQILAWIARGQEDALCVLDESHKIKSPSGRASTMIVSLSPYFVYRVLATGTVQTKAKRAHDIYMQWKFLNPGRFSDWPTLDEFKNNTGKWIDSNGYPQWVRPRTSGLEEMRRRIHEDSFAITREETGLPSDKPDVEIVRVPLSAKTGRIYDEMAEQMVAELRLAKGRREIIEASITLVQTLRLAQITSGIGKTDTGKLYRIGSEKLTILEEYVDDAVEHDEKIILIGRFKPDLAAMARMCREKFNIPTFELRGGVPREQVDVDLVTFARYDGCAAYVCQPDAAALGVDMRTAPRMIWLSLTTSWVNYTQMNDRNALFPGLRTQTYIMADGTVDETIYEGLQLDGNVAQYIHKRPESLLRTTPRAVR